jgi:hypothetical protein
MATLDRPRWSRSHTIWLLIALSLAPGIAAALFREQWSALLPGVRWATYIMSAVLISALCVLIVRVNDPSGDR